jgi:hypothetical protein
MENLLKISYNWRLFFNTPKKKSAQILLNRFLKIIELSPETADFDLKIYYKRIEHTVIASSVYKSFWEALDLLGKVSYRHDVNSPTFNENPFDWWECDVHSTSIRGLSGVDDIFLHLSSEPIPSGLTNSSSEG